MTEITAVDADLMRPARMQDDFQQTAGIIGSQTREI
jgi:hypothetical protein